MLLDESKILDLSKGNSKFTQQSIEKFLEKHQRAGSGEVAFITGENQDIRKQVTRSAFLNNCPVNYDFLYNNGCMIVEVNN
jgi:fatty acid-binding protein DegV